MTKATAKGYAPIDLESQERKITLAIYSEKITAVKVVSMTIVAPFI